MICENSEAVQEIPDGEAVPAEVHGSRSRTKGTHSKRRKLKQPVTVSDDMIEYVGIQKQEPPADGEPQQTLTVPEHIAEGFSSDTISGRPPHRPTDGLIYEIAEELYIKEKTAAELEALAKPPFHQNFDEDKKTSLDREAVHRTRRVIAAAGEAAYQPCFLPEAVYEDNAKPLDTRQALLAELLMLIPFVNIAAAVLIAMNPSMNESLRSFCRAFLLLLGIVLTVMAGYLIGKLM